MKKITLKLLVLIIMTLLLGSISFADDVDPFPEALLNDEPIQELPLQDDLTQIPLNEDNIFQEELTSESITLSTNIILTEDTVYESLDLTSGSIDLNGYTLTINGNFNHISGNVIVNGGRLIVNGNYLMQKLDGTNSTSSELRMTLSSDYVLVTGDFVANSTDTYLDNYLTNGVIEIKGDLTQKTSYFIMSGNGKIVLSGKSNPKVTLISSIGHLEINNNDNTLLLNDKLYVDKITSVSGVLNINTTTGNVRFMKSAGYISDMTITINGNAIYTCLMGYKNSVVTVNGNSIHDLNSQYFDGTTMTINGDWLLKRESGAGTTSKIVGVTNANEVFVNGNINGDVSIDFEMAFMTTHISGDVFFLDFVPNFGTLIFVGTEIQEIDVKVYSNQSYIGNVIVNNPIGIRLKSGMGLTGLDSDLDTINIYSTTSGFSLRAFKQILIDKDINFYGNVYFSSFSTSNNDSFNFVDGTTNITGRVIQEGILRIYDAKVIVQENYDIEKADGTQATAGYLSMQSENAHLLIVGNLRINGSVITENYLKYGTLEIKGNVEQIYEYFETGFDFDVVFSGDMEQSISATSRISNIIIDNETNSLTLLKTLNTNSISSPNGTATLMSPTGTVKLSPGTNGFLRINNTLLSIKGNFVLVYNLLGESLVIENNGILNVENDMMVPSNAIFIYDGALVVGNDLLLQKEDGTRGTASIRELRDSSYVYVDGNLISNGNTNYFEKGVFEVKGNASFLNTNRFYIDHYFLMTGIEAQTLDVKIITATDKIINLGINKAISSYQVTPSNAYNNLINSTGNDKPIFPELPDNYFIDRHLGESHVPSGNFALTETDLNYSAPGFDVVVERTYNSNASKSGLMGNKWHFGYESKIVTASSGDVSVYLSNGSVRVFAKTDNGYTAYDSFDTLEKTDTEYIIRTKDLIVYRYNVSTGYLKSVSDINGKTLTFDFASDGKINKVTDQSGRKLLIEYGSNGLVSKITDPMGREVLYYYSGNLLTSYVDISGETYTYEYDTQGYLTKVKNNQGTVLQEVTYDHGNNNQMYSKTNVLDNTVFTLEDVTFNNEGSGRVLSKTNALGNTVTYNYDDLNKTVQMSDSTGKTSSVNFDKSFEITSSTNAEGKTSTTSYNEDLLGRNRFTQVNELVDKNNNKTYFEYDSNGNTTKVTNPLNQSSTVVYDVFNNVIESIDVDGNKSYFIYSEDGSQLLKAITPINGTDVYQGIDDKTKFIITSYEYYNSESLDNGLLKSTTSPEGLVTTYTYDDNGFLRTSTTGGETTTTIKNMLGWTTLTISPLGFETTYDYDAYGRVVRITDDAGNVSRTVYDNKGNVIQEISPEEYNPLYDNLITNVYSDTTDGIRTQYFDNGLVDSVIDAMGNTTSYVYDIQGNLISETKPNGSISLYEYDVLNRMVKVSFKDNASTSAVTIQETTYTLLEDGGSQIRVKNYQENGIGYVTTTTYDALGRTIKTENPDGSIYQTVYNENGSVQKEIDPKGTETTYVYDKLGRVIETKVPFEIIDTVTYYLTTKTNYDNDGKVLYTETLNSLPGASEAYSKTEYKYNALGQVEAIILYDGSNVENITQYYYDAEGRKVRMYTGLHELLTITGLDVVSGVDTDYSVTKYEYNYNGQMTKLINPMGFETTYGYDKNGNLIESVDPNGTVFNYEYNLNSNLLREYTTTFSGEGEIDYAYTYDGMGNRLTMVDANKTTTYMYNEKLQLVSESDTLGTEKLYTYNLTGNRKSMLAKFNNSVVQNVTYDYDNMGRLIEVLEGGNLKTTYTYDINGNRATLVNANGTRSEYTYNLANSLKTITNYSGQTVISGETYTYYLNGNIFEKTDQSGRRTTYVYDELSRLKTEIIYQDDVETNRINYLYDDYNNRMTKQVVTLTETYSIMYYYDDMNRLESTYSSKDGATTYTYDNNGNTLSEVSIAKTTTYKYNSLNELISTNDGNKNMTFAYDGNRLRISKSVDGTTLQFLNDRESVIAEILGTEVTVSYLRGINLIAMVDPQGEFEWFYHFNYHGDVTELTDATGTVVKSYKYDAFGIEENIDPNDINPFRYTAEYFDKETGTIYLRARYYNPSIGRFINQDSYLGDANDPLSLNLYTYVINNPIMFIDPSGHNHEAEKSKNKQRGTNNRNSTLLMLKTADEYYKYANLDPKIGNTYLETIKRYLKKDSNYMYKDIPEIPNQYEFMLKRFIKPDVTVYGITGDIGAFWKISLSLAVVSDKDGNTSIMIIPGTSAGLSAEMTLQGFYSQSYDATKSKDYAGIATNLDIDVAYGVAVGYSKGISEPDNTGKQTHWDTVRLGMGAGFSFGASGGNAIEVITFKK